MTEKTRRNFFIGSIASVFVMAVAVLFGTKSILQKPFAVRSSGETVNETITWNKNSTKTSHSDLNKSYKTITTSGTAIYLYSMGTWGPTGNEIFDGKEVDGKTHGIYITSEPGNKDSLYAFQNITKVSVTTGTRTTSSSSGFKIYAHGGETIDVQQSTIYTDGAHTYNFNIQNGSSLVILPKNGVEFDID